jgi:hypothetical protein
VAEHILNTPFFVEVKEDRLVWNYENHGNYMVKSGYKNYIKSKAVEDNARVEGAWSSLWRVAAPPKTKHLLWRICRGCLPTRVRLRGSYVPWPSECPLRVHNEEDDWHILFGCSESQQVWNESGLGEVITPRLRASNDVKSVIFDICRSDSESTVGNIALIVWCIWHNRRPGDCEKCDCVVQVWNGVKDSAKEVAMRAGECILS